MVKKTEVIKTGTRYKNFCYEKLAQRPSSILKIKIVQMPDINKHMEINHNKSNHELSQPNNHHNHNPNNKTTDTCVGLRLSKRWETTHHHYHTNSKLCNRTEKNNIEKTKTVQIYEENPKQFLNPSPIPKIAH